MNGYVDIEDFDCEADFTRVHEPDREAIALKARLKEGITKIIAPHGRIESMMGTGITSMFTVTIKWDNKDSLQYVSLTPGGLEVTKSASSLHWSQICANAPSIALPIKSQGIPTVFYHNLHTNAVYVDRVLSNGPRMVSVDASKPTPSADPDKLLVINQEDMMNLLMEKGCLPVSAGHILARTPESSAPYALVERYEVL